MELCIDLLDGWMGFIGLVDRLMYADVCCMGLNGCWIGLMDILFGFIDV